MRKLSYLLAVTGISAGLTACATPKPDYVGFLSSYEGLEKRAETVRASVYQRRDEALASSIERVQLEPAILSPGVAQTLTPDEQALILGEMDRQVCYEMSERFTVVDQAGEGVGRVRMAATHIAPTNAAGSVISAAANWFIPGPIGVRVPGSTGGLAGEAELLTPDGRQAAAIVWARNATVVGTDSPSLSRVGDAHQLAEVFGDMVADAFAPEGREVRPIASPDPCLRYGPRNRVEGFLTRFATGLYQPELSGGPRRGTTPDTATPRRDEAENPPVGQPRP